VAGRGMTEEDILQLARNVERAGVNMEVELGRTIVSLRDLVTLQVGDVVLFDKPVNEPLLMRVNDREKYRVYPGVNKDRVAVQIASVVEDEE
jgi:flagellar motor switch protein FliM